MVPFVTHLQSKDELESSICYETTTYYCQDVYMTELWQGTIPRGTNTVAATKMLLEIPILSKVLHALR